MAKKTVRIVTRETVVYDQTFEMTAKEVADIKQAMKKGHRELGGMVDGWINRMDVHDAEPLDGDEVEVYVDGERLYDE